MYSHFAASLSLCMGTLTGRLVASRKSVIRLRWMISMWMGRRERWEEDREARRVSGLEVEEEVEDWEEKRGRRRNSNMSSLYRGPWGTDRTKGGARRYIWLVA